MSSFTSTGTVGETLQETLDEIMMDDSYSESDMVMNKYFTVETMKGAYSDEQVYAGPGLWGQKAEGAVMGVGTLRQGYKKRYFPNTYAMRMIITEEAQEDSRYPEVINMGHHIKRSGNLTVEYAAALVLARAWNSSFAGPDGVELCSASHPLTGGGTFSNTLGTPAAPSVQALNAVRANLRKMVGHDGLIDGMTMAEKVIHPAEQEGVWDEILNSSMRPESGNFAAINTVKKMRLTAVCVPFWTSTSTNWMVKTNRAHGLTWKWRVKMKTRSWITNEQMLESFGARMRFDYGWGDPRGVYGSQAG